MPRNANTTKHKTPRKATTTPLPSRPRNLPVPPKPQPPPHLLIRLPRHSPEIALHAIEPPRLPPVVVLKLARVQNPRHHRIQHDAALIPILVPVVVPAPMRPPSCAPIDRPREALAGLEGVGRVDVQPPHHQHREGGPAGFLAGGGGPLPDLGGLHDAEPVGVWGRGFHGDEVVRGELRVRVVFDEGVGMARFGDGAVGPEVWEGVGG